MHKLLPIFILLIAVCGLCAVATPIRNKLVSFLPTKVSGKIALSVNNSCVDNNALGEATGEFDSSAKVAYFDNKNIPYPKNLLAQVQDNSKNVLAAYDSSGKEKWIEVALGAQMLRAWEGNQVVDWYPISSGKWGVTPTGTFDIYWKLRYTRMKGGKKEDGDFYDLPNVPDTMYFNQGWGIHGAYWHNNFGNPMSHGCINEPLDKAHWLFEWAGPYIAPNISSVRSTPENPGSKVCIHKGSLIEVSGDPQAQACPASVSYQW